ncbi:histidine kinase [Paenibacillus qinlingensis]|uniref:Two-component system sensor histidine kinase YesM n=1 Tax=Paenibacillus qinlingensis TaxID=1837343 RepID=A0ABU1NUA3_9BACL|nr:histidine kinase [Paenibacillus qinlingensis]MDR6551033.1 two-component system sensor histidine kinase YesM [Paenibacillus qinlingensis]
MVIQKRTIRFVLFQTYSLIIIVVLSLVVVPFYIWSSDLLKKKAVESLDNLSQSMQDKLDLEIRRIDSVSLNILYSNLVKDKFLKFTGESGDTINNNKDLADILVAANGPALPVNQIYLYDLGGNMFGSGIDNRRTKVNLPNKLWYEEVLANTKGKYITIPEKDDELSLFLSSKDAYSISLVRLFFDANNTPEGIVEVKQDADKLFTNINDYMKHNYGQKVIVYTDTGDIIYPTNPKAKELISYFTLLQTNSHSAMSNIRNPITNENEIYSIAHSEYTGWNIALLVSEQQLLGPLYDFTKKIAMVSFAILLLAISLSYLAAKRITKPIARMHATMKSTNLVGITSQTQLELNSGLNELDRLQFAFNKMSERLKESMDQLLLSQLQELQAKMLALQSQMNPHFLYNTLTTISIMAEENMNEQIVIMIENLSMMLRYISADNSSLVPLETELAYTEKYLECIKLRHKQNILYTLEIAENMQHIPVPRLIIQPLVENSLKYSSKLLPPWTIKVRGYQKNDHWFVEVTDNGPGFDQSAIAEFNQRIQEIEQTGIIPGLQLDGMGLLNIYLRLKISYNTDMYMQTVNLPDGGAKVIVGGKR